MTYSLRSILALALVLSLPAATLADDHHGSQGNSGGNRSSQGSSNRGSNSGPSSRPPAPPVTHNQGGFNLSHDINTPAVQHNTPVVQHNTPVVQHNTPSVQHTGVYPANGNTNRPALRYAQPSSRNLTGGPYRGHFNGPSIHNPHNWGGWGWNHGMAWNPAPIYWGGGFWGAWALDNLATALFFGSIVDYQDQVIYQSYEVEPDSPGATLLENYGLQQTQCGPPNLVVIWGPDNSVICAYPNDLVSAGNYELDPATLSITSSGP